MKYCMCLILACILPLFELARELDELDDLAQKLIENYHIKGIGVVGVKDGNVVYKKGFGARDEGRPFTNNTNFYIASLTKAFIGLELANLVSSGKLNLDDPITKYIPQSYWPTGKGISRITVKDFVTHSHGLSNDGLAFRTSYTGQYPKDLRLLLRHTTEREPREEGTFHYSNFGYLVAGMIIEKLTGETWQERLEKLTESLGLNGTVAKIPCKELAQPFGMHSGKILPLEKTNNTLHAAGGLYSTLNDMGKFLQYLTESDHKSTANKLYFSPLTEHEDSFGPLTMHGYGLGWNFGKFLGEAFNFHTGNFPGSASYISYMPDKKTGVYVFVNNSDNGLYAALLLNLMFHAIVNESPAKDNILQMGLGLLSQQSVIKEKESLNEISVKDFKHKFKGKYYNAMYGTLRIKKKKGKYIMKMGDLKSPLYKSDSGDSFLIELIPGKIEQFQINSTNNRISLSYEDYGSFYRSRKK